MADDNPYNDGDIVWVKLGNNWWPGEVITNEDRLPEGFNQLKRKPYCVVKFFQENAYEYPKNAKQVHPFQCPKKEEFTKKGLALYNAKNAFMEKFPEDVKYAESQTRAQANKNLLPFINDRSDSIVKAILSDGRVRKSTDYYESGQADISGGRNSREQSILRRDSVTTIMNVSSNRASFGSAPANATPSGVPTNSTSANSACQYRCNICDFTTMRQNVLIMHRKSHTSGSVSAVTPARTSLTLAKSEMNNSIIVRPTVDGEQDLSAAKNTPTSSLTKKIEAVKEQQTKVVEESNATQSTPKRSRKNLSSSPNTESKRTTRSTPHLETEPSDIELQRLSDEESAKANAYESPQRTKKIRERLLADWSDEEKDESEQQTNSSTNKATTKPEEQLGVDSLQLPTTSSRSQGRRRTPTIVPMTALEGAGQTLVVGAVTQTVEIATKPPRIRNIPKKDRLREFEKNIDAEATTEAKPETTEANDDGTSSSTALVTLIKSAEKQKSRAHSKAGTSAEPKPSSAVTASSTFSCFDFQEEEDNGSDVLQTIAKFKKKYYSPEKEKQKNKTESPQTSLVSQRDLELSAEIDNLLESTNTETAEFKGDAVPVKGLPIKERGKRIFKSRNRSRLEEDDEETESTAVKQVEQSSETAAEEATRKTERKLRGRNTPQTTARVSPINGNAADNTASQQAKEASTEAAPKPTTAAPKRRNRKPHSNRIMQQLIDEEEASIPFISHSPVELYSCDVAADVGATLVPERGLRSKTSTPNSVRALRDVEVVNGNNNTGGGADGGSRASSRNLNAPPLTPTDETSSYGISEAGAEFGSPASSLDEERLLTPLETPNQSEHSNDLENCTRNETSSHEVSNAESAVDDDEIESPQHEALSGNELDCDSSSRTVKRQRPQKKATESKSRKETAKANALQRQPLESSEMARDSPKRSLRRNRQADPPSESNEEMAIEKTVKDAESETEVAKETTHRKTRTTRSQTPQTSDRKVHTPISSSSSHRAAKIQKDKTSTETEGKNEQTKSVVAETTLSAAEAIEVEKTEGAEDLKSELIEKDKVFDVKSEAQKEDIVEIQQILQKEIKTEDITNSTAADADVQTENKSKSEPKVQTCTEQTATAMKKDATEKDPANEEIQRPLPVNEGSPDEPKQTSTCPIDYKDAKIERNPNTQSGRKFDKKSTDSAVSDTRHKNSAKEASKSESCVTGNKSEISDKMKTSVDDSKAVEQHKHDASNDKQSPHDSSSRKRRAEQDQPSPHNNKTKKEDRTESPRLDEAGKHKHKSGKREQESKTEKESRPTSPKKQHNAQSSFGDKSKATSSPPTSATTSTSQAVEITRINVDVANPLSKHPSIVASMQQQHSNVSRSRSPKHKTISPLKRKLSHELIGQNVDGSNDAVVAHVQSLCPQVKITRKERLIEPTIDAAIPEKLLATPKKSGASPDISQMPIVLSTEMTEVSSPPSLVSSSLWQTDLLQPPPSMPSEQQQTPPLQSKVGLDPRVQKYVMSQSPTQTSQGGSNSDNGRLSPQKSQSVSATGGRKQAGNTLSLPAKQHKFAEALALADSILTPSSKPTKRRSSQQTVSTSSTTATNTANSNRRSSSTAAIDTRIASTEARPAKIPKQIPNEMRSKSNSPTKMQSGNRSGSGSNSPAPKSNKLVHKQKQNEVPSDEIAKDVNETNQVSKVLTTSTPAPTTTLVTAPVPSAVEDAQTVVEAEQLNSSAKITAVPIQPIPGYAETFMLCMFVDDVYKPINNIPHYLNKDLNQLVPVPPEAYEGILPEFVVEQPLAAGDSEVGPATGPNTSSTMTTPSGKSTSIVSSREAGESAMDSNEENELRVGLQLDESMLVGNGDAAAIAIDADAAEAAADNAIVLKLENQHIILDAASFEQLLANPDANTQLLLEDGTEFVLTREVLAALKAQHDDQTAEMLAIPADQQQQQQLQEAGSSADLLSVALANSEFYGGEMLQIETTLGIAGGADAAGLQLLASDGSIVFQAPPLPQAHLTPPITAHTSETNAVLNQTPIMSTLEKPSTGKASIEPSPTVVTAAVDIGARPNLDDSLAVIGVSTQSSTVPTSLELPITITNPAIAPKVSLAGSHANAADLVQFQPRRSVATAAVATSPGVATLPHIYDDSIDNIN